MPQLAGGEDDGGSSFLSFSRQPASSEADGDSSGPQRLGNPLRGFSIYRRDARSSTLGATLSDPLIDEPFSSDDSGDDFMESWEQSIGGEGATLPDRRPKQDTLPTRSSISRDVIGCAEVALAPLPSLAQSAYSWQVEQFQIHDVFNVEDLKTSMRPFLQLPCAKFRVHTLYIHDSEQAADIEGAHANWVEVRSMAQVPLPPSVANFKVELEIKTPVLFCTDMAEDEELQKFGLAVDESYDMYRLTVQVARGKEIIAVDRSGTSDPFIQVQVLGKDGEVASFAQGARRVLGPGGILLRPTMSRRKKKQTQQRYIKRTRVLKKNNSNPSWDEQLQFDIPCSPDEFHELQLKVQCWDWGRAKDTLIGEVILPMSTVAERAQDSYNADEDNYFDEMSQEQLEADEQGAW
eukprot:SAG25_NODE_220_length_11624_cov_41.246508_7_plen_406_part_00